MKSYFAYIRVSTVKQGERGSSLQEQRDAINGFAARNGLRITAWFEERETAAKVGRTEFSRMLAILKKHVASGVIFHKIDRSARNLRDWSVIQELADRGFDVRFSQESISLESNEGKLTGDFLAVIASHYIRNLREEVKKGIRGRLKQGLYPLAAPIGYLNQGGGKAKTPDPARAPFILDAFELYASGKFSLHSLSDELYARGLRSKAHGKVGVNRLAEILRNPFYVGVIRMKRSGETYPGVHEPIVPIALFGRVQRMLDGKMHAKCIVHDFLFRRLIACFNCHYHLIGERQKGHVYYRCHTRECPTTSLREEALDTAIKGKLVPLELTEEEFDELREMAASLATDWHRKREGYLRASVLRLESVKSRLSALMDMHLDGSIDLPLFEEKKLSLLVERRGLEEQSERLRGEAQILVGELNQYLELVKALSLSYEIGNGAEKRQLLKTITSNLRADRKNVVVELKSPFREAANLSVVPAGAPVRSRPRTFTKKVFKLLVAHFTALAEKRQREEALPLAA